MNTKGFSSLIVAASIAACASSLMMPAKALAQAAGANQTIYRDEQELLNTDQNMIGNYQASESRAEQDLLNEEKQNESYRLYAEKRINALEKAKKAGTPVKTGDSSNELMVLQRWLRNDDAYRAKQQAYISQLDQAIANLRQGQSSTMANLGNDINAMRQSVQDEKDQQKFNNQMSMNMYNELKSEMGAAAWGDCPRDGTYNSVGGYGFLGGYGYSGMGGRRWLGGGGF